MADCQSHRFPLRITEIQAQATGTWITESVARSPFGLLAKGNDVSRGKDEDLVRRLPPLREEHARARARNQNRLRDPLNPRQPRRRARARRGPGSTPFSLREEHARARARGIRTGSTIP